MNTEEQIDYIGKINSLTDQNDHSGALLLASEFLDKLQGQGKSSRTKQLEHVKALHELQGYLSEELGTIRDKLRPGIKMDLICELDSIIWTNINI